MSVVVDAVTQQGTAQDPLSAAELATLATVLAPPATTLPLPPDHLLFSRLLRTAAAGSSAVELLSPLLHVCQRLAACPAHRPVVLDALVACGGALQEAVAAETARLTAATKPAAPGELLPDVLLALLLATGCTLRAAQALEAMGGSVFAFMDAALGLLEVLCGAAPGRAPPIAGGDEETAALQLAVAARAVGLLRELLSWPTYRAAVAPDANTDRAMRAVTGGFHTHVMQCGAVILERGLFAHVTRLYGALRAHRGADALAGELMGVADAALCMTGHLMLRARRALAASGAIGGCFLPALAARLAALSLSPALAPPASTAASYAARVVATTSYACPPVAAEVLRAADGLLPHLRAAAALCVVPAGAGAAAAPGVGLAAQLLRLAINARWVALAQELQATLPGALGADGRAAVAALLADPRRASQPVDLEGPCWQLLGPLLVLARAAPAPFEVAQQQQDAESHPHQRQQQRGRPGARAHSRGRREERPGRARSQGRGRRGGGGRRRSRPNQRQRARYERLRQLLSLQVGGGAGQQQQQQESLEQRMLEALVSSGSEDDEGDGESGSSEGGHDHQGDTAAAADNAVPPPPSGALSEDALREWRQNEAPAGIPRRYLCDLSLRFIDSYPVMTPQGYTFDFATLQRYLQQREQQHQALVCPLTGEPLAPRDLLRDTVLEDELKRVRFRYINLI